jgi:hypothetical protein
MSSGWGRRQSQRLRLLSLLSGGETQVNLTDIEIRADALIRYRAQVLLESDISVIRDGSECGVARNQVRNVEADQPERWPL